MDIESDPLGKSGGLINNNHKWNGDIKEFLDIGNELSIELKEQRALLLKCKELLGKFLQTPKQEELKVDDGTVQLEATPLEFLPITELEVPDITKEVDNKQDKIRRDKRRKRRIRNDRGKLLQTIWDDINAESAVLKYNGNLSDKNHFFREVDQELWKSEGVPHESFNADKYSGIYRTSATPVKEVVIDAASTTSDSTAYRIAGLRDGYINHNNQFKEPRYTKSYWPYNERCEAVGNSEMPFEKGISDVSGKPVLPRQSEELAALSANELFMKLSNAEFLETCFEKSQTKRTGSDSMTAQERAIRRQPRDEHEVGQILRLDEQFLPMMIRLIIMFFFIDVPRKFYVVVGVFVLLFLMGVLDLPMRLIDILLSRIFTRPPLIVQMNNLAGTADNEENTYDEEIPALWKRTIYQTVLSFFMLFMPWWSPDPHYLR